jgi:hypothetical protein
MARAYKVRSAAAHNRHAAHRTYSFPAYSHYALYFEWQAFLSKSTLLLGATGGVGLLWRRRSLH